MKILVINAGSSSIKYQLFDMEGERVLAAGLVERIGEPHGRIRHTAGEEIIEEGVFPDHRVGLARVVDLLLEPPHAVLQSADEITAVGHRVVHGGARFSAPTHIDQRVKDTIRELIPLAPLHNPPNLAGIEVAQEIFPHAPQVAVFDTAFHQTMPETAYRYAIPAEFYEQHQIRAYGFHGISHSYVTGRAIAHLGQPAEQTNLITLHLGNGCSMTAVRGGRSVDTSMGFTPLPGLIMGTRSGDIDPAVIFYLARERHLSLDEIDNLLNRGSGMLGLGGSNDLRDIERRHGEGDPAATLALAMYTYRIKKYIGAYLAALGRVDALVFTAGVGENSELVRREACAGLEELGIVLDPERNAAGRPQQGAVAEVQATDSRVKILVIPTNEELEIARQTAAAMMEGLAAA